MYMVKKENYNLHSEIKSRHVETTKYYLTNDYCFKRLFGHKGNEKITEGLIQSILEKEFEVVEVKSDDVTEKDLVDDKVGVLDVFIKEKDGTGINLEMQMVGYDTILKRILFYWAKKYIENIQSGETYKELKPTKIILIANFELKKLKDMEQVASSFKILDTKTGSVILTEDLEIVIIELPKMKKYKLENKSLESWLKFIENPESLGGDILENNEALKKAKEEYDKIMADEHERTLIKLREKYMLDYNTLKEESYEHGQKDGYEHGYEKGLKQKNIEIAKKLLQKKVDLDFIMEITGLTEEDLKQIN